MWKTASWGWAAEWRAELGSVKGGQYSSLTVKSGGTSSVWMEGLAAQPLLMNLSLFPF